MKRYISMALILGMMLSILSIIPVQAQDATAAYPYTNMTFDTSSDISAIQKGSFTVKSSDEGVGGSVGAASISCNSASITDYKLPIKSPEILVGRKAKISLWVKLDTAKTKVKQENKAWFIIWGKTLESAKTSYRFATGTTSGSFNSGEWVKIESILDNWDGTMNDGKIDLSKGVTLSLRFGGTRDGTATSGIVAADSPQNTLAFWLDEVRVEPVPEKKADEEGTEGTEETDENNIVFQADCDTDESISGSNVTWNSGAGCDNEPGYMSFSSKDSDKMYSDMDSPKMDINYNTLYRVSVWAKADDDATVGHYVMYNVLRDKRMDRTYDSEEATPPSPYGDNQQIKFDGTLTKEWQYFESYFKRNVKSFDDSTLSIKFRCGNNTKGRNFSMDNFKVEVVGEAVTNGDFEWEKNAFPQATYTTTDSTERDDYARYGTFYSWFEQNAVAEVSFDVPDYSDGTQSAKITTTGENAEINQGLYVTNETDMVFKFWAKGEGESVGKPIQVKLDRTVPAVAEPWTSGTKSYPGDEFIVPDVELLGEELYLSDEWEEYEVRYQPAFTGGTSTDVIPRLPFVSIVVDGGAEGLTYYLDDITYEAYEEPTYEVLPPEVTDLYVDSTMVAGDDVYLYWMFNTYNDGLDETIIRVTQILENGEEATLAIQHDTEFTIPETAMGSTIHFDILPCENVFNEDGEEVYLYGEFVPYTLPEPIKDGKVITPTLGEIGTDSVTGSLYVENNKGETLDLFLLVALYDENNCAIRYETKDISVAVGSVETVTVSVSAAGAEGFAPVKYAKAIALKGTGVFDTDLTPYTELLVVEKN